MATNIAQQSVPSYWTSSNDNIIYEFSFNPYLVSSIEDYVVSSVSTGYIKVTLATALDVAATVGERFQIIGTIYNGIYKINEYIDSTHIVLETPYIGSVTPLSGVGFHLRVPTFTLNRGISGYTSTPSILTSIQPSITYSNEIPYIIINVKGIVKRMFTINSYNTPDGYDADIFDGIWLEWDGLETQGDYPFDNYTLVLNCAMTNDELNEKFTTGGFYLCPTDRPIIYDSGVTFLNYISSSTFPVLHKYINGVKQ